MRSIRRTLVVTLLAAVAALTAATALVVVRLARQEIDAIFDYQLRQLALSVADRAIGRPAPGLGAAAELDVVIQVWDRDGVRLYRSRPDDGGLPEVAQLGFTTLASARGDWRVYSAQLSGLVIQVAQPLRVRRALALAAAWRTLAPVLLLVPLLTVLAWWIAGRALEPLARLARTVASRTPATLEPISERAAPEEALPLVRALDDLLSRLGAALAAQRAFVADAAHELRTPLAALKLQAQLVERARDPAERAAALAELRAGLDRATHLVQQLLTLARAEPDAAPALAGEPVRLADVVGQAVADHAVLAEAKRVDLGATGAADDAVVVGDAAALRTLLANLVDNALRHAPEGGRVDVAAGLDGGRPWLEVADHGPGIPQAERERVFDRFYRRRGAHEPGSGLGLSIVRAIAERHRARVRLGDTPGGGLTVRVEFPPQPSGSAAGPRPAVPDEDGRP